MPSTRRLHLRTVAARWPRLPMAAKAATAAALAWVVVLPMDGAAEKYAYYAPLGAVVAVSTTLVDSVRVSVQSLGAILLGAVLAYGAALTPLPDVVTLAVAVGLGVVMAGWPVLGVAGSWVPTSALFVLIVGSTDGDTYFFAFLGLTSLGAVIGVGINLLLPPLPLTSAGEALASLRRTLADQLDDLGEGLEQEVPPTPEEWEDRKWEIGLRAQQMRQLVSRTAEARSANWRARRWRDQSDHQHQQGKDLQRLSLVVEGLTLLLVEQERADLDEVVLGPVLRSRCAHALRCAAVALREEDDARPDHVREADEAVTDLRQAIYDLQRRTDQDVFAAGAVVTAIQQVLDALRPTETARSVGPGPPPDPAAGT